MSTPAVFVAAIGLAAPGLAGWAQSRDVLRGERAYAPVELPAYQPTLLPPNERRRASPTVRMAFRVAEEAMQNFSSAGLATVFASADGDLQIASRLCSALAAPQRLISPTDFHNSVHNAAAGYWSIASGAQGPATAIAAWDEGFAVGLLEALGMVSIETHDALLVAYDVPGPEPLLAKRPVGQPFGVALLLTRAATANTLARMSWSMAAGAATTCVDPSLEALRRANPAARALPLLSALARRDTTTVRLPRGHDMTLQLDLQNP